MTARSWDNFPNPSRSPANPYVPNNSPAISELFDLFDVNPRVARQICGSLDFTTLTSISAETMFRRPSSI